MINCGRTCIVTGASRGLGRAIAISLGMAGYRVVVNYAHSGEGAEETVKEVVKAGGEALSVRADVREVDEVRTMVNRCTEVFGAPQVIVNNAIGPQPFKPLEDYSWKDFQDQLDFCVKAPLILMQATVASMKTARFGRVINICSEVIDLGNADFSAYVSAKGAQWALTRAWARELGPWQITVNNVNPGFIPVERHVDFDKELLEQYRRGVPLGRQGVPQDIGETVAFLASDGANFISGQTLAVNGANTF